VVCSIACTQVVRPMTARVRVKPMLLAFTPLWFLNLNHFCC
jgi:hypothetical protein